VRRGRLVLAISSGAAPAMTQAIRQHLETEFDAAFASWADLLAEVRPILLARISDPTQRKNLLHQLCQLEWPTRIRLEGTEAVRTAMYALMEKGG
jgi:siroheme synthase (precorrin-2 oxidase/ferrochelatase)